MIERNIAAIISTTLKRANLTTWTGCTIATAPCDIKTGDIISVAFKNIDHAECVKVTRKGQIIFEKRGDK